VLAASASFAPAGDAKALRELGNAAFKAGRKAEAAEHYTKAIAALDEENPDLSLIYSNRALVKLQLADAEGALSDANSALMVRPMWGKGLHRRAQALVALGRDVDAFRFLVEALDVPQQEVPDVSGEQRRALQKQALEIRARVQAAFPVTAAPETDDAWITALEAHGQFRVRLATLAHCWNEAEEQDRMAILNAALGDLAAAPDAARSPIASLANIAASEDAQARGRPAGELSREDVAKWAVALSGPHPDGPARADEAGMSPSDLKAFPLTNYEDVKPPKALVGYFVGLPADRKVSLWHGMWCRLAFYERMLVANDFSMFFEPVARLCPLLDAAVRRLRESTAATMADAAAAKAAEADA